MSDCAHCGGRGFILVERCGPDCTMLRHRQHVEIPAQCATCAHAELSETSAAT